MAVKLIHPHLTGDADFLRRFEAEAEAVAQLRHSNIIRVFDFSQEDGQYYMIMEFVPGESLQDRLKRLNASGRTLSSDEIVAIAGGVCDAVDYAHKRGMIHRDVKPANILLSVEGQAILTDFGLAKLAGGTQHTAAGAVMGTALYMSPEQIRGEQVDHR
ncbi:MAG: serine/threonine-protein kinase, partial [Dehalococcoidia bacterium]